MLRLQDKRYNRIFAENENLFFCENGVGSRCFASASLVSGSDGRVDLVCDPMTEVDNGLNARPSSALEF